MRTDIDNNNVADHAPTGVCVWGGGGGGGGGRGGGGEWLGTCKNS